MLNINELNSFDPLNPTTIPDKTGLYFLCIRDKKNLPALESAKFKEVYGRDDILYIGIAKRGLRERDYKNHFEGSARESTLRKSLGSLLGWKEADRFRFENEKHRKYKYSFNLELEQDLEKWMKNNLIMFYQIMDDIKELERLEIELIKEISPPINIKHNIHSLSLNAAFAKNLKKLRTDYHIYNPSLL